MSGINRFGYYLRSLEKPYPIVVFVFEDDYKKVPCIGEVVEVQGVKGFVNDYWIVPSP